MTTETFYRDLPTHAGFLMLDFKKELYPVPEDWHIVITDIKGSTAAIEAGKYKTVNMVGALSIVALLNLNKQLDLPFVFGGDGASIAIPPSLVKQAEGALQAAHAVAQTEFNLELRVGILPLRDLYADGHSLRLAKFMVSDHYQQAIFSGDAIRVAESWLKSDAGARYRLAMETTGRADFSGLECRWKDIPSSSGETVSLIVQASSSDMTECFQTYQRVMQKLLAIYGSDQALQPINKRNLSLSLNPLDLLGESKVHTYRRGALRRLAYLATVFRQSLSIQATKDKKRKAGFSMPDYSSLLLSTSDYRKFDDVLRMVISSRSEQRKELADFLESEYRSGTLLYGLHVSDRAHMTCLVFKRDGRQVHFVDGADGGYAFAARELKKRQVSATQRR